jgi:uncharacterized protein
MNRDWCSAVSRGVRLAIQVTPNAKKNEVIGVLDGVLKIRLHAEPIEGKANDALIRYLAASLSVPKSAIEIIRGHTGKQKVIEIDAMHLDVDDVRRALLPNAI